MRMRQALATLAGVLLPAVARGQELDTAQLRVQRERLVNGWLARLVSDRTTLAAMRAVPRHEFVPAHQLQRAYEDTPLPIGHDATISAPSVVALMTEAIRPRPGMRVLEVGTGSGYQAAVLAAIGCRVWTIEIVGALADVARARLARLGYQGVEVRHGDGWLGWPEAAPFDAILVTAAPEEIPPPLLAQLAPGGRLVAPVGPADGIQYLLLAEKDANGAVSTRRLEAVRFVPLQRRVRPD